MARMSLLRLVTASTPEGLEEAGKLTSAYTLAATVPQRLSDLARQNLYIPFLDGQEIETSASTMVLSNSTAAVVIPRGGLDSGGREHH